ARAEAEAWAAGTSGAGRGLRGEVAFLSPYYRVRIGEFGSRAQAEAALDAVRAVYPEAFLVPDLVTVYE
ncbi:MAG TPA: SPOR domain-containing protein, partial [Rhodothermales bacterium]|nr:SPOR domain-containing protein [Rhodothermales bacterium]